MIDDQRPDQQGQEFTLTTRQLAEDMGITPDLVRRIKADNPDRLVEGHHWIKTDQNICLWSAAGVAELRAIRGVSQPCESGSQPCDAPSQPCELDTPTLASLAADFEAALRPHARKVAQQQIAQQFQRLVEEETRLEYQRLIEAANRDELAQYGFTDPLYVVGAAIQRNGHKALAGVGDV